MKNMLLVAIVIAAFAAVGTVIALSSPIAVQTQNETEATQLPVFPEEEAPPATATESGGGGSILVQSPEPFNVTTEQGADTATIHVKLNLASENTTTVIPPNGTIIQVPGNVTVSDNDTVIITSPNDTITEIPGNVTVITPPVPEPCGCPVVNETAPAPAGNETAGGIPPVLITPAPGQNITEVPPVPSNETEVVAEEPPAGNETAGNETTTVTPAPGQNITILPAPAENDTASVEPASLTAMYENFVNRLQA